MSDDKKIAPGRISLPTETVNEILTLLNSLPYGQVASLIAKIQQQNQPVLEEEPKK